MLFALIAGAVALAGLACIVIALLNFKRIITWFRDFFANRSKIKKPNDVAFTLKNTLASGKAKVVQGIFNQETEEIEDGVEYEAEKLDEKLDEYHRNDDVVVYQ